ncbi:MAG TPA: AAA family ATPase, partial [Xanthobacteraceae bacterium]|nr:AAA family ATPase [Xanthobacteraceae bacterium]
TVPSRFIDELPEASVEVAESKGGFGWGGYGSRFDSMESFGSNYGTPGWQRAQNRMKRGGFEDSGSDDGENVGPRPGGRPQGVPRRAPLTLEGELVAKSTGTVSTFAVGARVFHQKFGYGNVVAVEGNKLTIQFDKAGEKRVVDSFVEAV